MFATIPQVENKDFERFFALADLFVSDTKAKSAIKEFKQAKAEHDVAASAAKVALSELANARAEIATQTQAIDVRSAELDKRENILEQAKQAFNEEARIGRDNLSEANRESIKLRQDAEFAQSQLEAKQKQLDEANRITEGRITAREESLLKRVKELDDRAATLDAREVRLQSLREEYEQAVSEAGAFLSASRKLSV